MRVIAGLYRGRRLQAVPAAPDAVGEPPAAAALAS